MSQHPGGETSIPFLSGYRLSKAGDYDADDDDDDECNDGNSPTSLVGFLRLWIVIIQPGTAGYERETRELLVTTNATV